jgi:hypothetical protein
MSRDLFLKKTNRDWSRSASLEEASKSVARAASAAEREVSTLVATARRAGYDARPRGRGLVVTKKWRF